MYYDKGRLLSYKRLLNMVIGVRGGGKTYGFKKWAIDDFIKNKKQFVWIRRHQAELDGNDSESGAVKTFFKDIKEAYPKLTLEVKGSTAYINEEVAGYFVALSTSQNLKSSSYPQVNKILFDEFLIENNAYCYLKNEVNMFLGLIDTIFRLRNDGRVVMIGNATTWANPYFLFFNVRQFKGRFYVDKHRPLVIEMYKNSEFIKIREATNFGQLVKGTDYGDYALENVFLMDNEKFIAPRSQNAKFRCLIVYKGVSYGFWIDWTEGLIYASKAIDPSTHAKYTLSKDEHDINLFLIKKTRGTLLEEVVYGFQNGIMRFEDQLIKGQVMEILAYFIR